ncbi:hypothetical protein L103DPR2_02266 [Limnohabitans sp. 103DPR2]|nr:hypothetical protein L103DPR2_02266 [Limnohabitans sp. 103DPR2]
MVMTIFSKGVDMNEDPRCCGTGTCIIDPEGRCWCGQQWDGEKMAMPKLDTSTAERPTDNPVAEGKTAK